MDQGLKRQENARLIDTSVIYGPLLSRVTSAPEPRRLEVPYDEHHPPLPQTPIGTPVRGDIQWSATKRPWSPASDEYNASTEAPLKRRRSSYVAETEAGKQEWGHRRVSVHV
jgi:hypothetical protein